MTTQTIELETIAQDAAALVAAMCSMQRGEHVELAQADFSDTLAALLPQLVAGGFMDAYTREDGTIGL